MYEFDIPSVSPADGLIVLTKVSNSTDLIKDITTAGQLNYIGNKQFISEIIKKAEAVSLSKSEQKQGYTELLNEITEKYNKPEADEFVKQEAYTVLKEDLEYIISHIQ
jgi:polyhydroxyalkanoate synthesis regulator phasin